MGSKVLLLSLVVLLMISVTFVNSVIPITSITHITTDSFSSLFVNPFMKINSVLLTGQFKFTNFFDSLEYNTKFIEIEPPALEIIQKSRSEIEILELSFSPQILKISLGEEVTWVNKRKQLDAFIIGIREINGMRSPFLQPEDEYSFSFDKVGKFTFSDGVVIGLIGQVIVE